MRVHVCVCVCTHFIYSRDVFCSTVATCTIMYIIMRGGAWVGRASETVNIVKCVLIGNHTILVEAGYIMITLQSFHGLGGILVYGRLKSLLIKVIPTTSVCMSVVSVQLRCT